MNQITLLEEIKEAIQHKWNIGQTPTCIKVSPYSWHSLTATTPYRGALRFLLFGIPVEQDTEVLIFKVITIEEENNLAYILWYDKFVNGNKE